MTPRPQKKRSRSASPFRDVRRQTKTTTSRASSPLHPAATAGKHRRDDSGDEREPKRGGAAMALKDRQQELSDEPIYDLFHFGHARALEQAKKSFPNTYLLVGVCNDELTLKMKGRTVMNGTERAESLRHCKWVDEVIVDAPWVVDQAFLDKHKIDYVAHDDIPYASADVEDVYSFVKKQGKFLATKRTEGVSTSDLITRIVRDYDKYVRRNLERGVSAKDLNVGFLKEKELQVKKQVEDLTDKIKSRIREGEGYIKENWSETKNELITSVEQWDERSGEMLRGFLSLFGRDGPMKKLFRKDGQGSSNSSALSRTSSPGSDKK